MFLFEETLTRKTAQGKLLPAPTREQRIVRDIKAAKGKMPWPCALATLSPRTTPHPRNHFHTTDLRSARQENHAYKVQA
jgi:hypothetical protein